MDISKTFVDIISNKTCFLCFTICPEMMKITDTLEIRWPYSIKSFNWSEIVKHLFPSFDIICSQVCRGCSDMLIGMHVVMFKNNFIRNLIRSMTKYCDDVIEKTNTKYAVTIDLKKSFGTAVEPKNKVKKDINTRKDVLNTNCTSHTDLHKNFKVRRRKKYYTCVHCPYRTLCKDTLEGHNNKNHLKTRPFTCDICFKSYYRKSNLTEHKQIHDGNAEICEVCGYSFARKQSLLNHLKLHANNKAYKCTICEKSFINSGRRLDHMKRNHMDKKECCVFCEKKFAMKKELLRHMKSVHA